MNKINVLSLGGCAASDIIQSNKNYINLYNLDVWLGSFSRQMWPKDKIANRLEEEFHQIWKNRETYPDLEAMLSQILYILKSRRTPETLLANLPVNTVIIIDPAYEIKNFYFDGNEIFDITLKYNNAVRPYLPNWLSENIRKNYKHFDCGIMEIAVFQFRSIKKFLNKLKKLNVPVIVFDNLYTDKIYDTITNSVATSIPIYNTKMPFEKQFATDLERHDYSADMIDRFYENWRDIIPEGFKIFSPDRNLLYADVNHRWNYHPTHLHHTCRRTLESELSSLIVEAISDHNAKNLLINRTHNIT